MDDSGKEKLAGVQSVPVGSVPPLTDLQKKWADQEQKQKDRQKFYKENYKEKQKSYKAAYEEKHKNDPRRPVGRPSIASFAVDGKVKDSVGRFRSVGRPPKPVKMSKVALIKALMTDKTVSGITRQKLKRNYGYVKKRVDAFLQGSKIDPELILTMLFDKALTTSNDVAYTKILEMIGKERGMWKNTSDLQGNNDDQKSVSELMAEVKSITSHLRKSLKLDGKSVDEVIDAEVGEEVKMEVNQDGVEGFIGTGVEEKTSTTEQDIKAEEMAK